MLPPMSLHEKRLKYLMNAIIHLVVLPPSDDARLAAHRDALMSPQWRPTMPQRLWRTNNPLSAKLIFHATMPILNRQGTMEGWDS